MPEIEGAIERGPDWYDQATRLAAIPLEDSPWLSLYAQAMVFMPPCTKQLSVLDIGCGTGRFAKMLKTCRYVDYLGIDFAPRLIEMARCYVPGFHFATVDILNPAEIVVCRGFKVFVMLEILEHLREDLALLGHIPSGALIVGSVPNYGGAETGHVRRFETWGEVVERYAGYIRINRHAVVEFWQDKRCFVFQAVRR